MTEHCYCVTYAECDAKALILSVFMLNAECRYAECHGGMGGGAESL
jgi:hypothetical protein